VDPRTRRPALRAEPGGSGSVGSGGTPPPG